MQRGVSLSVALSLASTWIAVACFTGSARAQAAADDKATATALFKEAKALFDQGLVEAACAKFEESQRLDPGGGTLLNLALCHETQRRLATAWTEFTEAAALARRDNRPERLSFAQEHLAGIEPILSKVVVSVPADSRIPGLEIRRNGSVVGQPAWGSDIPVDGGNYVFEATAPGHALWKIEITVAPERDRKTVEVPRLQPVAPSPAPPVAAAVDRPVPPPPATPHPAADKPPRGERASTTNVLPWVIGGVGLASLGVGTYFGFRAFDQNAKSDDACPAGRCSERGVELSNDARSSADISTVTCAIGVAALGVSGYLLLTGDDAPSQASTAVGAGFTPGGGNLQIRGSF